MFKNFKQRISQKITSSLLAIVPCGSTGQPKCDKAQLFILFRNLLSTAIILGGLVVGIAIIFGGFLVLTSAGDEGRVTKGRKAITSAVIGFAIVLSAWLIVNTILTIFGCTGAWYLLDGSAFSCQ